MLYDKGIGNNDSLTLECGGLTPLSHHRPDDGSKVHSSAIVRPMAKKRLRAAALQNASRPLMLKRHWGLALA
jgi:hypothetical protein